MNDRSAATSRAEHLADAIVAAMPRLGAVEREVAIALYRTLAEGHPVQPEDVARRVGIAAAEVAGMLARWPGAFMDEAGAVVGFWGLAIPKMPHRFEVDGIDLHTWCAWDPLFIAPLLGKTARVASRDPVTGATVSFTVTPAGVEALSHAEAVVSFLAPDEPWDHAVIQRFCHFVLLFESRTSGSAWVADHPGTVLLSVGAAFELGRITNARQFRVE
ncbi:MAG: organomercurial lyase [Acidobacteriota bacterium]